MPRLYKNKFRIKTTRLQQWDYGSAGMYFVTICTKGRKCWFGKIVNGEMKLSEEGEIVSKCWYDLLQHYSNINLDEFKIMPNHIHGIIEILCNVKLVETGLKPVSTYKNKRHTLSELIRAFKTFSARKINILHSSHGGPFWQPRFYDHIIRSDKSLDMIRYYIRYNAQDWKWDDENPMNL